MSEHLHSSQEPSVATEGLAVGALARRRMLLSGLGKGSVVLAAAAVPMHSLASETECKTDTRNPTGKHLHARPSRCGSEVGSKAPSMPIAQGYHRSCYEDKDFWPRDNNGKSCADTPANEVISTRSDKTCIEYLKDTSKSSEKKTFLVGHANAIKCGNSTYHYPHSTREIKQMALGQYSGCTDIAKCEKFLRECMETLHS
jgi:hypothetical protein